MMNILTLRPLFASACLPVLAAAALLTPAAHADIVNSIDDGELGGTLTLESGADAVTLTDADGKTRTIKLIDIDEVNFGKNLIVAKPDSILVVNNDNKSSTQSKSGKIKLKAGLHRFTLPYWQGIGDHKIAFNVSGPGINGQVEVKQDHLRSFRDADTKSGDSPGIDNEGYRLPELGLDKADDRRLMLSRARYRLYVGDDSVPFKNVGVLEKLQLKRSGTTSAINTGVLSNITERVGVVYEGYFKADQDGEYNFSLSSNDGSQLYFGDVSQFQADSLGGTPINKPWRAELRHNGKALGELKSITDQSLTFHIPLVSDVALSLAQVRSVWDNKVNPNKINRENEPANQDTVYLRDKSDKEKIVSVSGKVTALDDTSLAFEFRGQERSITRDRVVGLVFAHDGRPVPKNPGLYQVVYLDGGQVLPCRIKSIGDHAAFEMLDGGMATPPRDVLLALRTANGRRVDLTDIDPTADEAIPFFGLKLSHRVNSSFAGKPIMLFNEKTYERGLAVHSKSRLHYKLDTPCERFQATFGLMNPGGKLGDVTARVLGDGKVLWEQANITAETGSIDVDVTLKGVERLILEVDFGGGQDVGDRAAWCNPRLVFEAVD